MPLQATTVRFDSMAYEYIRAEAAHAGVSVAQFIREAALMRAVARASRRETPGVPLDIARLGEEVERRAKVR